MSVAIRLVQLLFLQGIWRTCLATIDTKLPKPKDAYSLIEPTVKSLMSCYAGPGNEIAVVGDPPDVLVSWLMSERHIPVVLTDCTRRPVDSAPVMPSNHHKLHLFLIMASTSAKLQEHLTCVKKSRWWNHMADFWLVEWPARENDCTNAYAFLWMAWKMNILEAKFVCSHRTRGKLIYGFNPYTRYAPEPWRLENVYNGENEHAWSLLSRELSSAPEPCRNMSFDKTEDLGRYEIRITVKKSELNKLLPNKTGLDAVKCPYCSGFSVILRSMNATVKLLMHGTEKRWVHVDATGRVSGILAETYYGVSDIALLANPHIKLPNLHKLRPHYFTGVSIMTQYSGSASQVQKIASLVDVKSRLGLLLVCVLTFMFFKYFLRQTLSIASLNVLRLICNSCLIKLPSRTSLRIYLGSIFFFVVTFQGIYQGALSSLLAKRVPLRNIKNIDDLRKSDHAIYGHQVYDVFSFDPEFQGRFVALEKYNCTAYVLQNPMNACLRTYELLFPDAERLKLHLSEDVIIGENMGLPIREDWPLERKINQKIQALIEANIFRYEFNKGAADKLKAAKAKDQENRDRRFKVLNVGDLSFAFAILAIGLTMAAITFVVEVIRG